MKKLEIYVNSFFDSVIIESSNDDVNVGQYVVIESDKGNFVGQVIRVDSEKNLNSDCKILNLATDNDINKSRSNELKAAEALVEIRKIACKLELDMSFVDASFSLDKKRLYISFVSDNRVDFRELAKRLAQKYHTRIELRQIGVRDKAKKVGGIGPCGLLLCCNTFLNDFSSVSINMAKNQLLALNPTKINGVCGRLMCCLNYENDIYKEFRKNMPKIGNLIETDTGTGKVIDIDVFNKTCKVELPNKSVIVINVEDNNGKAK